MVLACSDNHRRRSTISGWLQRRLDASGSERGQALVITALAMTVLLLMCAASIDLSTWYQKHHQAQVSADAAALAAADCLAHSNTGQTNPNVVNCTSTTDTTDATKVANAISATNLPNVSDQVTINPTLGTVTVTATGTPQVDFAGIVGLHPKVSARSSASYAGQGANFSIFVGNPSCDKSSGSTPANTGLQIGSNGGGSAAVNGLYSDGLVDNNDDSSSASYSGGISDGLLTGGYNTGQTPNCGASGDGKTDAPGPGNTDGTGTGTGNGTGNAWNPNGGTDNTALQSDEALPYPEQYTEPQLGASTNYTEPKSPPTIVPGTCTFAATYFSTDATGINQIDYPGIYCVINSSGQISTTYTGGGCGTSTGNQTVGDDTAGSIYVGSSVEGGGFEFVGPCVIGDSKLSSSALAINSATPLIYGTAGDTSTCLEPDGMVNPTQVVNSPDNVYLVNNNLTLNAPIYAPCGTVELAKNNDYAAFIEAANVTLDQNNFTSYVGTGPPSSPAQDGLTS